MVQTPVGLRLIETLLSMYDAVLLADELTDAADELLEVTYVMSADPVWPSFSACSNVVCLASCWTASLLRITRNRE